jgi:ribA/ribD-fused uncharacterized protein
MPYADEPGDIEELCRRARAGWRPEFLFFWSHEKTGQPRDVGAECFSQWYPAPFEVEGVRYSTAEHYMMASKARLFGDTEAERAILRSPHPGAAKRLGRGVAGFSDDVWVARREEIVLQGSLAKFGQHPALLDYLLGTKRRVLAEASPTDRVWGIGLAEDHEHARQPLEWPGLNLLGFALMTARGRLASEGG